MATAVSKDEDGIVALRTRWTQRVSGWIGLQPFTLVWVVVFVTSYLGLKYLAGPHLDLVVMVMGYVGIALCIASLLIVLPAALLLWRAVRDIKPLAQPTLEAGAPVRTGFSIPTTWWLPLVNVEWRWSSPTGVSMRAVRDGFRNREEVTFHERGRVHVVVREFTVADVLGLCRVRWTHRQTQLLTILPSSGKLRRMPTIQSFQSGDEIPHPAGKPEGGRYEIRRYAHGHSARHIVWKIFGRTRKLMVRQPERAIARTTDTAAYLIANASDEASAGAARVAIETGVLGVKWLFGADGAPSSVTTVRSAVEAVAISGSHKNMEGRGFPTFMESAIQKGFNRCITFAPSEPGSWEGRVAAMAAKHPGQVEVVIGTDGFAGQTKLVWWRRWFFPPAELDIQRKARVLDELVDRLQRQGVRTTVLDRPTGRLIGQAARAAMQVRKPNVSLQPSRSRR